MIMRFTITTLVYITIGLMISVGCIRLLRWIFSENQRVSLINPKWPYFLVIPPIATFLIMLLVYDEQIYSAFRASTLGFQFRDNYGVLAYYLLGWPMVIAVLLSIVVAALYVFFKMPKDKFESEEIMATDRDLVIWEGSQIDLEKKIDDDLRDINDLNSLEFYIKSQVALFKNKVWQDIFDAKTENKRKILADIKVDTQIKKAKRDKILANFKLNNVDETIEIKRLNKERDKEKLKKQIDILKNPRKSGSERYQHQKETEARRNRIDKDIAASEKILDTLRDLFEEFDTITAVLEEAKRQKLKIMEDNMLSNEDKIDILKNIDVIVRKYCQNE